MSIFIIRIWCFFLKKRMFYKCWYCRAWWCRPLILALGKQKQQISVSSRPAQSTDRLLGQVGICRQTLPQKTKSAYLDKCWINIYKLSILYSIFSFVISKEDEHLCLKSQAVLFRLAMWWKASDYKDQTAQLPLQPQRSHYVNGESSLRWSQDSICYFWRPMFLLRLPYLDLGNSCSSPGKPAL